MSDPRVDATTDEAPRAADGRVAGRRGQATRQRLLAATRAAVGDGPYRDLKVVDISRRADTSPATFYQYFPDVETAVLALIDELTDAGGQQLRALVTEAELVEAQRVRAVEAALANRIEAEERRAELDEAIDAQVELVIAAETRLEARLAEAAFLDEVDADLAAEIRAQEEAIARRIREEAARKAAAEAAARRANLVPPAGEDDLVNAEGFLVHESVGDSVTVDERREPMLAPPS